MTFNKKILTSYGVEASFWEIIETHINFKTKTINVILAGYYNEKAYFDNKNPLEGKVYSNRVKKENKTEEEINKESEIFDSLDINNRPLAQVSEDFIKKYIVELQ
jgi:hypothetical protein